MTPKFSSYVSWYHFKKINALTHYTIIIICMLIEWRWKWIRMEMKMKEKRNLIKKIVVYIYQIDTFLILSYKQSQALLRIPTDEFFRFDFFLCNISNF
jgi:hypothetical protein